MIAWWYYCINELCMILVLLHEWLTFTRCIMYFLNAWSVGIPLIVDKVRNSYRFEMETVNSIVELGLNLATRFDFSNLFSKKKVSCYIMLFVSSSLLLLLFCFFGKNCKYVDWWSCVVRYFFQITIIFFILIF